MKCPYCNNSLIYEEAIRKEDGTYACMHCNNRISYSLRIYPLPETRAWVKPTEVCLNCGYVITSCNCLKGRIIK